MQRYNKVCFCKITYETLHVSLENMSRSRCGRVVEIIVEKNGKKWNKVEIYL
jgi:hypothetical protein